MKLCESQKEIFVLLVPIIICLIFLAFGKLDLLWAIFITLVGDGLLKSFFILRGERINREEKHHEKLIDHYQKLGEEMKEWLSLSVKRVYYLDDFPEAMNSFYLNSWSFIKRNDKWNKWAIRHICDEKGYPQIASVFDELCQYEKNHNNFVSTVVIAITEEVKGILINLKNFKEKEEEVTNNFYYTKNVLFNVYNYENHFGIYGDQLIDGEGRTLAKGDSQVVTTLKIEIENIRLKHKDDFENIENGFREDKKTLNKIKSLVEDLIYDLSINKPLKGKCDYCMSLGSSN